MKQTILNLIEDAFKLPCTLLGRHKWAIEPAQTIKGNVLGPFLACPRCCETRALDEEPPAGHPDSMSPLSDADEALLRRYDFTQGAI